ncbi:hypothetical protein A3752_05320 [Oleiphilus sp. HI0081]|uniref:endonuclease/exonuclease/phosphatase family protein n=1 Tax=Oleiphilus sp. HI0132 TaxID=1822270 RepID=UPI0007C2374E|nr:endonuclease/exonuclease/phosphatase family protein [Oleiphilus sp. HI0132]KZY92135.1 hypothetical protein A3743_06800 [Oleiphilus sp. HI0072]KZZ24171.1 hypothetical protein A3752_05320 [Oleiphilus sp. HI0081]KZZ75223.1 hypothetical protein A3766_17265 [Oleiphilus sp. HI0132]
MVGLRYALAIKLLLGAALLNASLIAHAKDRESTEISVMSWNVWFDKKSGETRYPKILDEVAKQSPDIVFFQEVIPQFVWELKDHELMKSYHLLGSREATRGVGYGQAFLTRYRLLHTQTYNLDSKYDRKALFGLYEVNPSEAIVLINVHLESGLGESRARKEQINAIRESLLPAFRNESERYYPEKKIKHVIWGGDFNLGFTEVPEGIESFIDVGRKFEDNTPTYHIDNNKLADYTASWLEDSARLDRVFISETSGMSALSYKVINSDYYSTLSDHYPIHVVLEFQSVSH